MNLPRRSFPTAKGWCFARTKHAYALLGFVGQNAITRRRQWLVLILRDARTSLLNAFGIRAPADEDGRARVELRLIAEPLAGVPSHDVKQPISFPRRVFC